MDNVFHVHAPLLINSSIEVSPAKGISVKSMSGATAKLAIIDSNGNILDDGPEVATQVWNLMTEFCSKLLMNEGRLTVYSTPPGITVVSKNSAKAKDKSKSQLDISL